MKLVINALQYKRDSSGIGVLLRELFGRYASLTPRQCELILPKNAPPFPAGGNVRLRTAPCTYEQGLLRALYQSFLLGPLHCRRAVLLAVDSKVPFLLPLSCRVVPLVTDLAVFRLPETYQATRVLLWWLQYRFLRRRADGFLAISEFTKREMVELLHIPPERIQVLYCAAPEAVRRCGDLEVLREKYALPERYILFVGNFNPRKNLRRLLRAFDRMKRETSLPHALVIAGGQGWKFDAALALEGISARESVCFPGYVPDEDLSALYSGAELFVFPSLYEGFGIPVIEAQRCGTPVLAARGSALPEVCGEGACYVDPCSEEDICRGMTEVLTDPALRERLRRAGEENARRFSWEASAWRLHEIIEGRWSEWTVQ